jgi:hypothetical protein
MGVAGNPTGYPSLFIIQVWIDRWRRTPRRELVVRVGDKARLAKETT